MGRQPHTRGELHTRAQGYFGRAPISPPGNGQADGVSHRRRSWAPEVLGHSNIAIALEAYSHAIPAMQSGTGLRELRGKDSNLDYLIQSQASYH